jgi:hypothetical protein
MAYKIKHKTNTKHKRKKEEEEGRQWRVAWLIGTWSLDFPSLKPLPLVESGCCKLEVTGSACI